MDHLSKQHEAAERVYMRRWLRKNGINPVMGNKLHHTVLLMQQVLRAGGEPHFIMSLAKAEVNKKLRIHAYGVPGLGKTR